MKKVCAFFKVLFGTSYNITPHTFFNKLVLNLVFLIVGWCSGMVIYIKKELFDYPLETNKCLQICTLFTAAANILEDGRAE